MNLENGLIAGVLLSTSRHFFKGMRDTLTSGAEQILLVVLVGHHTYEQPSRKLHN
jgi:hypothetical protein